MNVEDITGRRPEEVEQWVRSAWAEGGETSADFNWLGLAEVLAFEARNREPADERIKLAGLAVTIYEWLAEHGQPDHADANVNSATALRVYMLSNGYILSSDPLLGMNQIMKPLREAINLPPLEAAETARDLKAKLKGGVDQLSPYEVENFKTLRRIKNRLALIKSLPPDILALQGDDLDAWLRIYGELP